MSARLALGTVQFGLRYGVANEAGQVGRAEARVMMDRALAAGFDTLDTAIAYGQSEATLGAAGVAGWQVITKLPARPPGVDVAAWVRAELEGSLRRLATPAVHAVLLHRPAQLLEGGGPALYSALAGLKDAGLAQRIGISIYDPNELDALQGRFALDIVQLPFNILDARWARSGWLARLHAQGTEIHARSAFLQGLLLMPSSRRPTFFARWQPLWDTWDAWLGTTGLTPLQACLRHALSVPEIAKVVVGVDSLAQLQEIIAAAAGEAPAPPCSLATQDTTLLNPAAWKLN